MLVIAVFPNDAVPLNPPVTTKSPFESSAISSAELELVLLTFVAQFQTIVPPCSVALAMNHNVKLQVLSSFENKKGTFIINERQKSMEETIISGITYTSNEAKITLINVNKKS